MPVYIYFDKMRRRIVSAPCLLLVLGVSLVNSDHAYYHHGKQTDYYGEYYRDRYTSTHVYTYCYDSRYHTKNLCRPGGGGHAPPGNALVFSQPSYASPLYSHYDGRNNINVGKGRYYRRGRDLVIECEFPRYDRLISNVVWYRKAYKGYYHGKDTLDRHRIRVDNIGRHGSRLVIYDYRSRDDDGIYRCFATRHKYGPYSPAKETVYMEIEVLSKGWLWD